jgi:hypothetical protein
MVVAVAAVVVAVVLADEMPVATANAAPDTRPAASTSVADRDSLHLGAFMTPLRSGRRCGAARG